MPNGLRRVGEHRIVKADVDAIGHMSVRRYAELAETTATRLFDGLGDRSAGSATVPTITDIMTRQHGEQFLGAHLLIDASVVVAGVEGITLHIELRNGQEELASTHLVRIELFDTAKRFPVTIPKGIVSEAMEMFAEQPPYGRPRRLNDRPWRGLALGDLAGREVEVWSERVVAPDECDALDWFAGGPTQLAWGPPDIERPVTQWRFETPDGGVYALANVEHRRLVASLPRLGAPLRTVAVNVAIERNRRVRREWTFDLDTGALHAVGEFVDLLVDLRSRRAADVPDAVRRLLGRHLYPELGDAPNDPD